MAEQEPPLAVRQAPLPLGNVPNDSTRGAAKLGHDSEELVLGKRVRHAVNVYAQIHRGLKDPEIFECLHELWVIEATEGRPGNRGTEIIPRSTGTGKRATGHGQRVTGNDPRSACKHLSTSATLHACATHPRGVYGASASKISLIVPMHASDKCGTNPSRNRNAPDAPPGGPSSKHPRTGRSATPTPSPGDTPHRASGGPHRSTACNPDAPAPASAAPPASRSRSLHHLHHRRPSRTIQHRVIQRRSRRSDSAAAPDRRPARHRRTS